MKQVQKRPEKNNGTCLVWFRRDLRIWDNPALFAASQSGLRILPVYIHATKEEGESALGAAGRVWLHHSLKELERELRSRRLKLSIAAGSTLPHLNRWILQTGATEIFWNRSYEPAIHRRDLLIEKQLSRKLKIHTFNASLIVNPEKSFREKKGPYRVFTPFWRKFPEWADKDMSYPMPRFFKSSPKGISSLKLYELKLLTGQCWEKEILREWTPGERGALLRWDQFRRKVADNYDAMRNFPAAAGTSRLSPHLSFGEISPRWIWRQSAGDPKMRPFLRQLVWREFASHLLFYYPDLTQKPLRPEFTRFPWADDRKGFKAWTKGKTGYPMVDAAMRELWQTGWMHNRARMITASFLVKDLRFPWQKGAQWFWQSLLDADLANNVFGWQWAAGCGADSAPYFRIFNPVLQGERFDPKGEYISRWIPELKRLESRWIHQPWKAPAEKLKQAGIRLGKDYPLPILDHEAARRRALADYSEMKHLR